MFLTFSCDAGKKLSNLKSVCGSVQCFVDWFDCAAKRIPDNTCSSWTILLPPSRCYFFNKLLVSQPDSCLSKRDSTLVNISTDFVEFTLTTQSINTPGTSWSGKCPPAHELFWGFGNSLFPLVALLFLADWNSSWHAYKFNYFGVYCKRRRQFYSLH